MKKIILVSIFLVTSFVVFSCTEDRVETNLRNNKEKVLAGHPISPTIPPRPK